MAMQKIPRAPGTRDGFFVGNKNPLESEWKDEKFNSDISVFEWYLVYIDV